MTTNLDHHYTWDILDSSKLTTYMDCPRRYFFEYVLSWRSDAPNNHLVFGTAYHDAMEHLMLNGYEDESVMAAFDKFLASYREFFPATSDELYAPKDPDRCLAALGLYAERYQRDLTDFETLYTEIAGTVPINDDQRLHFRLDSICRDDQGRIFSLEHKTGSRISRFWTDQWPMAVAVGTYTHVMNCLYDPKTVWGVKINGTFFKKRSIEFLRVPIRKTLGHMKQWIWNVAWWADQIRWQFDLLERCGADDQVLMAFPQQPGSCTKYFGCPYHDFCLTWPNPLQHCDEPPLGYAVERWDPSEREATHTMELK
jgi:hypothetical protein